MKRTVLIAVPATIRGRTLSVTYRVTVVANTGGNNTNPEIATPAWGYATAVPVRVTSEPELDFVITPAGDGGVPEGHPGEGLPIGDGGHKDRVPTGDGGQKQ